MQLWLFCLVFQSPPLCLGWNHAVSLPSLQDCLSLLHRFCSTASSLPFCCYTLFENFSFLIVVSVSAVHYGQSIPHFNHMQVMCTQNLCIWLAWVCPTHDVMDIHTLHPVFVSGVQCGNVYIRSAIGVPNVNTGEASFRCLRVLAFLFHYMHDMFFCGFTLW